MIAHELQINVPDWNQTVRVGTTEGRREGGGGVGGPRRKDLQFFTAIFNFGCPMHMVHKTTTS